MGNYAISTRNRFDSLAEEILEMDCKRIRYHGYVRDAISERIEKGLADELADKNKRIKTLENNCQKLRMKLKRLEEEFGAQTKK